MITILYSPKYQEISAHVPYKNTDRFISIVMEHSTLVAQTHLGKNLHTNCRIIMLNATHRDNYPLVKHFEKYKRSINVKYL